MMQTDYPIFDADNHYYEVADSFTRHMDPRMLKRGVQWAEIGNRRYHMVGGQLARAVSNPTFDPIAKPGALYSYLRGEGEGRSALELLRDREPLRAEYHDRDARIEVMAKQGLDGIWLFPTLGVLYEELLKHDIPALAATIHAFNRWIDEDWDSPTRARSLPRPMSVWRISMRPSSNSNGLSRRGPAPSVCDPRRS